MIEVGKYAGVSAQTVSRFFNGGYVAGETSERIRKAVDELGYRRNRLPVQMKSDHTDMLGLISLGPYNYGATSILTGVGRAARREKQALVIEQLEPEMVDGKADLIPAQKAIDHFLAMRVDGILLSSPFFGIEDLIDYVRGEVPVVVISDALEPDEMTEQSSSYAASRLAVRHLIELGHTQILHVGGPVGRIETMTRSAAYLDEMTDQQLEPLPIISGEEWDADSGAKCGKTVSPESFTAVFAANDELALGFSSELRLRGYLVPEDFSIIGFDDMPEARYFYPPLTTIRVDFEMFGERTVAQILSTIRGEEHDSGLQPTKTELIVRTSTARRNF